MPTEKQVTAGTKLIKSRLVEMANKVKTSIHE